ncbi:MAG: dinitrogenase iron-molybdenum cofactor biosynthesis protein, partial [Actinobacteria bacterium]|nr:dinitrogenase iron-molybdenum cofactor biosynthesis protein [Actinomycetota bacterium]
DTDLDTFEYYENESRNAMGGAGIKAAQKALENKVDAVISGSIGPNAFRVFQSSQIKIYTNVSGSIRSAIMQLKNNELNQAASSNVSSHYGMGR